MASIDYHEFVYRQMATVNMASGEGILIFTPDELGGMKIIGADYAKVAEAGLRRHYFNFFLPHLDIDHLNHAEADRLAAYVLDDTERYIMINRAIREIAFDNGYVESHRVYTGNPMLAQPNELLDWMNELGLVREFMMDLIHNKIYPCAPANVRAPFRKIVQLRQHAAFADIPITFTVHYDQTLTIAFDGGNPYGFTKWNLDQLLYHQHNLPTPVDKMQRFVRSIGRASLASWAWLEEIFRPTGPAGLREIAMGIDEGLVMDFVKQPEEPKKPLIDLDDDGVDDEMEED